MMKYIPTIGLEIHAELRTNTKMFCDCPNDPEEKHPNTNVCPICLGHPGVLPTINKKAIESMIQVGFAVNGEINSAFKFDRKNYFYPDLPKGYQISQYDLPLVKGGQIDISARLGESKVVKLNRVHLEEDAGKLVHNEFSRPNNERMNITRPNNNRIESNSERIFDEDSVLFDKNSSEGFSLVDFNRGGLPLMELVSEPDMHGAKEAVAFAKELQLILRYLGVADADLERGQMRFDANVSVARPNDNRITTNDNRIIFEENSGVSTLGTKVEIKNLNSFAALEEAINFEIKRQEELLESGKEVKQETRGWDDVKKHTVSQRSKEEAHDYRYFSEPDLPPLVIEASLAKGGPPLEIASLKEAGVDLENLKLAVPEMPAEKRKRLREQFKLNDDRVNILVEDRIEAEFFENAVSELEADSGSPARDEQTQLLFNYLNSDLKGLLRDRELSLAECKITPENFADLVIMAGKKEITSRTAKDLLVKMLDSGVDPRTLVENEGLAQVSGEEELGGVVEKIIAENPKAVEDYKKGKSAAIQFMVGKAMAELRGRGNPSVLRKLFEESLSQK